MREFYIVMKVYNEGPPLGRLYPSEEALVLAKAAAVSSIQKMVSTDPGLIEEIKYTAMRALAEALRDWERLEGKSMRERAEKPLRGPRLLP